MNKEIYDYNLFNEEGKTRWEVGENPIRLEFSWRVHQGFKLLNGYNHYNGYKYVWIIPVEVDEEINL